MKKDKSWKNILLAIIAFLLIFVIFKIAAINADPQFWVITILLILIYFELLDFKKK